MPSCETCGFAHALSDHCINCGSTDPFRRKRLIKSVAIALVLLLGLVLVLRLSRLYAGLSQSDPTSHGHRQGR